METWVTYRNGNYNVRLNTKTGTKIRENKLDFFEPHTIESMDLKITNCCDMGCKWCHENSTPDGKHADLFSPSFLDNLHPYTEIAIGGGNPLSHPDLVKFLVRCKDNKWIPSMTVNEYHFFKNFELIKQLSNAGLIYGVGISVNSVVNLLSQLDKVKEIPNVVLHLIAGVNATPYNLKNLSGHDLKVLILGYKKVRRGIDYNKDNSDCILKFINDFKEIFPNMLEENWFQVMSFDNLALKQLEIETFMDPDDYKLHYMGDDGIDGNATSASMFVDMVERKYAVNSCSMIRYELKPTIEEMYTHLRAKPVLLGLDLANEPDKTFDHRSFLNDLRMEQQEQM